MAGTWVSGLNVKKYVHLTNRWTLTSVCNLLHLCNKLCFRYPICFLTKTNPYNPEIQTLIQGKAVTINIWSSCHPNKKMIQIVFYITPPVQTQSFRPLIIIINLRPCSLGFAAIFSVIYSQQFLTWLWIKLTAILNRLVKGDSVATHSGSQAIRLHWTVVFSISTIKKVLLGGWPRHLQQTAYSLPLNTNSLSPPPPQKNCINLTEARDNQPLLKNMVFHDSPNRFFKRSIHWDTQEISKE